MSDHVRWFVAPAALVRFPGSLVRRWRYRELVKRDREQILAHWREYDQRDNQQLRDSYGQYPLGAGALVVGDIFLDADIGKLSKHICHRLPPDRPGSDDRSTVGEFLQQAQATQGRGATLGAIHFCPPEETTRWRPPMHPIQLPLGIHEVALVFAQFAPGMVMAALVIELPQDLLTAAFKEDHRRPTRQLRGGLSSRPLEVAKTAQIERHLRAAAEVALLPRNAGMLRNNRYPLGSVAAWTVDSFPSDSDAAWRDVARVVGVDTWRWWQADSRRLYYGVPLADRHLGGRRGYTLMVVGRPEPDDKNFDDAESALRYHLKHDVVDWLPLLLLYQAAVKLSDDAGRLRQLLNWRVASRLRT